MSVPSTNDDVPQTVARIIGGFGRFLIVLGLLVLLFAGFQLWGTGLAEARAQENLEEEFAQRIAARQDSLETPGEQPESAPAELATDAKPPVLVVPATPEHPTNVVEPLDPVDPPVRRPVPPDPGEPVGVIEIPAIGVRKTIVEGTSRDVLRSGPGHYRSTPLPGRTGNTAIAGHRTTHGAPFFDIDLLEPGDEIQVETLDGTATYLVEAHDDGLGGEIGHLIVDPSEVGVIADKGDNRLTLTACHPKYSAKERIIVTATLLDAPADPTSNQVPEPASHSATTSEAPSPDTPSPDLSIVEDDRLGADDVLPGETQTDPDAIATDALAYGAALDGDGDLDDKNGVVAASLGWQPAFAPATVLWAVITGLIALAGWCAGRFWRRFPAYAMAVPPLSLTLYYCFANLEKFLPAV